MRELKRRELIQIGAAGVAGAFLYGSVKLFSPEMRDLLLEPLADGRRMRSPGLVGSLEESEIRTLGGLYRSIGARWQMGRQGMTVQVGLDEFLDVKSSEKPSYLTEYRDASLLVQQVTDLSKSSDEALMHLLTKPTDIANLRATRLGHIQNFVILEFIRLHLANGGFRKFGYENYRGFMGGVVSDTLDLPYRPSKL